VNYTVTPCHHSTKNYTGTVSSCGYGKTRENDDHDALVTELNQKM